MYPELCEEPPRINLVDPDLYAHADPFAQWRWLRRHEPVYRHPPTEYPGFWALTRYADIRSAYQDAQTFSSASGILLRPTGHGGDPGGGRTLALTDPPRHRQLRQLVDEWFTIRAVQLIEPRIRQVARDVVGLALERETCDFVTDLAARIPLYVICSMMGVPSEDREHMFQLTSQAFGAGDPHTRRLAHLDLLGYFEQLAADRAAKPAEDLVSVLVHARIDGRPLSTDDIILNCDNLLVGGVENTRIAAAGGMLALQEHPDQWQALAADRSLLPTAVEEVLRWTSTATHILRAATRTTQIGDKRIEAGDLVTLWLPSANRDESVFPEPDRFDIRRQPNRHLALGHGEHFCLGHMLARVELRLLYHELLDSTERLEPAGAPARLSSIVVNGLESLPVRLIPSRTRMGG